MTRKRFIKNMMAVGFSRNAAAYISKQRGDRSYAQLWRDYLFGKLKIEFTRTDQCVWRYLWKGSL